MGTKRVNEQAKRLFASDIKQSVKMLPAANVKVSRSFGIGMTRNIIGQSPPCFADNVHLNKTGNTIPSRDIGAIARCRASSRARLRGPN